MARAMRRILVDHARRKAAAIHGGGVAHTPVDHIENIVGDRANDLIDLDDALRGLEEVDARAAEIVTLRYFAGLTVPEIAEHFRVSASTVDRQWAAARRWLLIELRGDGREWLSSVDAG
jgi:RNA polymerase sigma-70 factor (ECF subfamily)